MMSSFAGVPFVTAKNNTTWCVLLHVRRHELASPRPNELHVTIQISHGSSFRFGEGKGSLASALVLWRDAQDVRQGPYTRESADAPARIGLGRRRHGSCFGPETLGLTALHAIGKSACRGAHWLPFLSRRQFCRGQKSRPER